MVIVILDSIRLVLCQLDMLTEWIVSKATNTKKTVTIFLEIDLKFKLMFSEHVSSVGRTT